MELPNNEVKRALVMAYADISVSLGPAAGGRPLVLPNGEFFPDLFTGDQASVQRLLDRMLEHAGLAEMAAVVKIWSEDAEAGCGTGACGSCGPAPQPESEAVSRLIDAGDTWQINVLPGEVAQPVALSSALCRALALAVLREADAPPTQLTPDLAIDLTAVALGFGVLLLEGSHIYRKSCGGPSIARSTALGPTEVALVLALFAAQNEQSLRSVNKYLSPTQSEAFAEAKAWVDSNGALVQALQRDPERLARGEFELREASSWLGRWLFGKARRAPNASTATTIDELEAALGQQSNANQKRLPRSTTAKDPKFDEIKRLVDEALSE
ncbi:MAG: hypothetical protein ABJB12_22050 [Pseudomonadota bacterium]